jgi:hypothetical protein
MRDSHLQAPNSAAYSSASLVPLGYAEKSMASLMQLHSELMNEKERRVDLYRRLMDKEQALAELKMYVALLEEKIAKQKDPGASAIGSRPAANPMANPPVAGTRRPPPPPQPPMARDRARMPAAPRGLRGQSASGSNGTLSAGRASAADARVQSTHLESSRPAVDGWRTW